MPEDKVTSSWWDKGVKEEDLWEPLYNRARSIEDTQGNVHTLNVVNARLYANADLVGLDWTIRAREYSRRETGKTTHNIIESVIDTASAMIAKNRPRPTVQTDGAEWSMQRRARKLQKYLEGAFETLSIYNVGVDVFRDACVFGTGFMKFFLDPLTKDVCVERVLPDEIIVDEMECISRPPRTLYQRKFVDKDVLKKMFPDKAREIEHAHHDAANQYYTSWRKVDPDQVAVVEAWRIATSPGSGDGRHAIAIDGQTLLAEDWTKDRFPFLSLFWTKPLVGFYGKGLSETLTPIQLRINKLSQFIERAQDLVAVPRVLIPRGSRVLPQQINNRIGAMIEYSGPKPPQFHTPQAVGGEIYSYLDTLIKRAYELAGISMMSASSKKPVGLESAPALREYNDIETQRFAIQAQNYEQMFMDAAGFILELSKEKYRSDSTVKFRNKNFVQTIKWGDVDMKRDKYHLGIEAASILSKTPAGRKADVIDFMQNGLIGLDEARRLLGHPDVENEMTLQTAAIEDADATIESLLDGEFMPPEPFQNLQMTLQRVQMKYLAVRHEGAPEEVLQMMRDWMSQAEHLLKPPTPPPMPGPVPGMEGGMPVDPMAPAPEAPAMPMPPQEPPLPM